MVISVTHKATRCRSDARQTGCQKPVCLVVKKDYRGCYRDHPETSNTARREFHHSRPQRYGQLHGLRQPAAALMQAACCRITRLKARSSSEWLCTAGCGAESCSSPTSGNSAHLTEIFSDRKISRKHLSAINLSVTKFSGRLASADRKKRNRASNFIATDDITS